MGNKLVDIFEEIEEQEDEFANDNNMNASILPEFDEIIILEKNKNNRLQNEIFVV